MAVAAASTEEISCFTSGTERLLQQCYWFLASVAYVYTIKTPIMHKKISSAAMKRHRRSRFFHCSCWV